jgi:hypothetical protein
MSDIWGDMAPIEDKADAVMFTIGLMRRLAESWGHGAADSASLLNAAEILDRELEAKDGD